MNPKKKGFQKKKTRKGVGTKSCLLVFFSPEQCTVFDSPTRSPPGDLGVFQAVSITVKLWSPKKKTSRIDAPEVLGKTPMSVFRPKFTFAIFPMSVVSELSIGVISQNQAKYINQRS